MSYILDALKRAERERRRGEVSVLDETPAAPSAGAGHRKLSRTLLALAALLAVAVLLAAGGWLWGHRSARARPAALHHAAAVPAPVASSAKPAPQHMPPAVATAPPRPAKIEDASRIGSLNDLVPPPPKPKTPPPAPANGEDALAAGNAAPHPAQTLAPEIAAAVQAAAAENAAPAAAPPPSPPAAVPQQAKDAPEHPHEAGNASLPQNLQLMPDSYRAEFPQFNVNVHAYSDDPTRRFVLIDGKQYHEGDTLPQGPHIVAIVPEGIVFDWKGSRVLYALNR